MNFDCSKTIDFVHELNRMCERGCRECPFFNEFLDDSEPDCRLMNAQSIEQKDIDIVQKWSDEHPLQNRKERFLALIKGTEFEQPIDWHIDKVIDATCVGKEWWNEEN